MRNEIILNFISLQKDVYIVSSQPCKLDVDIPTGEEEEIQKNLSSLMCRDGYLFFVILIYFPLLLE